MNYENTAVELMLNCGYFMISVFQLLCCICSTTPKFFSVDKLITSFDGKFVSGCIL